MSLRSRLRARALAMYALVAVLLILSAPSVASMAVGIIPVALGVALRLWATGYLVKNDELTMSGPYAYLRHPLYLGTALLVIGCAIIASSAAAYAVSVVVLLCFALYYVPYKNRIEGARLEARYGEAFRRYLIAVPGMLPRMHRYRPLGGGRVPADAWSVARVRENNEFVTTAAALGLFSLMVLRWTLG